MDREDVVYQAVAARRAQWDNLVWQVPLLSLTAQAFLFTIALGSGTSVVARCIAAGLSLVISFLSITLMARHRQAELADAEWLEVYDRTHHGPAFVHVHGRGFQSARDAVTDLGAGKVGELIPLVRGFKTWVVGLGLFGVAALAVFPLAITHILR